MRPDALRPVLAAGIVFVAGVAFFWTILVPFVADLVETLLKINQPRRGHDVHDL